MAASEIRCPVNLAPWLVGGDDGAWTAGLPWGPELQAAGALPLVAGPRHGHEHGREAAVGRDPAGGLASLYARALAEVAPDLSARTSEAPPAGPIRAFDGEPGFLRRAPGPGWALVGDPGAFRDPITSHGITDALRDAEWLANAIVRGTDAALAEYEAARDELMLGMIRVSDAVASFDWTLDRVRALHLELSQLMAREVDAIRLGPQSLAA